jgi:hypothetical protein
MEITARSKTHVYPAKSDHTPLLRHCMQAGDRARVKEHPANPAPARVCEALRR